mmetsp:Transcript_26515/g.77427  ORF Transcript_26515/g.77427 Transcript_26515/m.77427 type:complete len:306 (+) Transcript_26515:284-1201(+)
MDCPAVRASKASLSRASSLRPCTSTSAEPQKDPCAQPATHLVTQPGSMSITCAARGDATATAARRTARQSACALPSMPDAEEVKPTRIEPAEVPSAPPWRPSAIWPSAVSRASREAVEKRTPSGISASSEAGGWATYETDERVYVPTRSASAARTVQANALPASRSALAASATALSCERSYDPPMGAPSTATSTCCSADHATFTRRLRVPTTACVRSSPADSCDAASRSRSTAIASSATCCSGLLWPARTPLRAVSTSGAAVDASPLAIASTSAFSSGVSRIVRRSAAEAKALSIAGAVASRRQR